MWPRPPAWNTTVGQRRNDVVVPGRGGAAPNPAEHLWESLREDAFANHVFADLDAVERALTKGLIAPATNSDRTRSMTAFKWIASMSLNAK
jgi:hypothetical protein